MALEVPPAETTYTTTYTYDRPLVRRLLRRDVLRRQGGAVVANILLAGIAVVTFPGLEWISGLTTGLVLLYCVFLLNDVRHSRRLIAAYAGQPVRVTIAAHGLLIVTGTMEWRADWGAFATLEQIPEGLILTRRDTRVPVYIPRLPPEPIRVMVRGIRDTGGRVDGVRPSANERQGAAG